jgi:hypothetical protein
MTKFVEQIITESRYFDKNTQELIDLMVHGFEEPYDEYELFGYPDDTRTDDAVMDALVAELNSLARHNKEYVNISVDKGRYELLQEAAKCPVIGKQHVIVDLGYSKVKITTECLYRAIKNQILQRALFPNQDGDGLFVRVNKQLLHDNAVSYQDETEFEGRDLES